MHDRTGWLGRIEPPLRLPDVTLGGTILLVLRWLALVLALVLASFDHSSDGVLLAPGYAALIVAGYNLVLWLAGRRIDWLRRPLNFLAVDTLVAVAAVYSTGGYRSGFFVLFVSAVIGSTLYLELVPTVLVTIITSLIFAATCIINATGLQPQAPFSAVASAVAAKSLLLQVLGVVVALLLESLRREHQETERERAQAARMVVLNNHLQEMTASLDLRRTLQTLADAAREMLAADVALVLLRDRESTDLGVAAVSGADMGQAAELRLSSAEPDLQTFLVQPVAQNADSAGPHPFDAWLAPAGELSSLASAPLRLEEDLLGLLVIACRSPRRFADEDLPLMQALAREAALAIRNARLYERERDQAERMRALEQMQRGFISSIAHELRTPLTCIRTSVDLLQAAPTPEVQQELAQTIDHHAGRLEGLVTELLESTRLEVGQVILTRQPTDLRLIVERTVTALAPMIQQRGQHLETALPEEPEMAYVDRRRIEQVLTNLLTNAHKFTPKGGHIWVVLARERGELVISVADDGPGIPPEHLPYLFQRFYTVPGGTAKTGLGLGLFITRELVELHGGRAWVKSQSGQGSTFFVAIPALSKENT